MFNSLEARNAVLCVEPYYLWFTLGAALAERSAGGAMHPTQVRTRAANSTGFGSSAWQHHLAVGSR